MWKRLDDSCWFLTDIKGTSSVLYDVNKKTPSIFNKEERLAVSVYTNIYTLSMCDKSDFSFCQVCVDHIDNDTKVHLQIP